MWQRGERVLANQSKALLISFRCIFKKKNKKNPLPYSRLTGVLGRGVFLRTLGQPERRRWLANRPFTWPDPSQPSVGQLKQKTEHCLIRPIHTRDFAPGACSRGTLREQSSSVCITNFMGILHPREQNFHPAKCSTIFSRLNIWEQAPGWNWANLKTLLVCTDTCKMSLEHAQGVKPLVCIGLKGLS